MKIGSIVLALLVAVLFGASALPAPLAAQTGLSQPVSGTLEDGGTFTGNLHITEFDVQNDQVVAVGTLSGTLRDAAGQEIETIDNQAVAWPLQRQTTRLWLGWVSNGNVAGAESSHATSAPPAEIAQTCDILNLVLGPLDLNLLGLEVHLNQVILDIVANPVGGLLGSLLCGVANLLNNPLADLLQIADLLNQILDLLG